MEEKDLGMAHWLARTSPFLGFRLLDYSRNEEFIWKTTCEYTPANEILNSLWQWLTLSLLSLTSSLVANQTSKILPNMSLEACLRSNKQMEEPMDSFWFQQQFARTRIRIYWTMVFDHTRVATHHLRQLDSYT